MNFAACHNCTFVRTDTRLHAAGKICDKNHEPQTLDASHHPGLGALALAVLLRNLYKSLCLGFPKFAERTALRAVATASLLIISSPNIILRYLGIGRF